MPSKVILLRHGERIDHINPSWLATAEHPSDSPLSPVGHQQAFAAAAYLTRPSSMRISSIYSSPFTRTLETSAPLSAAADVPVFRETGVSEWLCGDWFGGKGFHWPGSDEGGVLVSKGGGKACGVYKSLVEPVFPETRVAVGERVATGVRAILKREEEREKNGEVDGEGAIVIVAHGKVVEDAFAALVGADPKDVPYVTYCSVSEVVRDGEGGWKAAPEGLVVTDFMEDDIRPNPLRRKYA